MTAILRHAAAFVLPFAVSGCLLASLAMVWLTTGAKLKGKDQLFGYGMAAVMAWTTILLGLLWAGLVR